MPHPWASASGAAAALVVAAGMCVSACEGGYPIEPTPCDDHCLYTQRLSCPENDLPEECVSQCEVERRLRPAECEPPWLQLNRCLSGASDAAFGCVDGRTRTGPICVSERIALTRCTNPLAALCVEGCLSRAAVCPGPYPDCEGECERLNPGCEAEEEAYLRCSVAAPPVCLDEGQVDERPPEQIPCFQLALELLDCSGFDPG